jgi:hypothetical protein
VAESVLEHYDKVRDYLRQGNWAEDGRELEELEKVLKEMSNITKKRNKSDFYRPYSATLLYGYMDSDGIFCWLCSLSIFGPIIPELKQPIDLGSLSIGVENDKLPFPVSYPYVKTAFLENCGRKYHTGVRKVVDFVCMPLAEMLGLL